MGKILVTGGCGYIGSHTIIDLIDHGFEVISVDNLINASEDAMDRIKKITGIRPYNYQIDLSLPGAADIIFEDHSDLEGIIHFAALKAVGESDEKPLLYYRNNIGSLIHILECAYKYDVPRLIFSSSCTVYGSTKALPVTESTPLQRPVSPYGHSKQICEAIIEESQIRKGGQFINLRYFNPAGAHPSHQIGEAPTNPALNLVPIITETAIGKRDKLIVFGDDYGTRDGTCIRDYIQIMDLAHAHTLALKYTLQNADNPLMEVFNLGIGKGVSVLEAIHAFQKVSGEQLNYVIGPRRSGDIEAIYADYTKANQMLNWSPQYSIDQIMQTAWEWEKNRSS